MEDLPTTATVASGTHPFQKILTIPLVHVSGEYPKEKAIVLLNLHAIFKNQPDGETLISGKEHCKALRHKLAISFGPAFEHALEKGKLDVAKWWWAWYLDVTENPTAYDNTPVVPARMSPQLMEAIAKNGHVEVFQWLRDIGLFPLDYAEGVLDAAAGAGQLKVLNWWYAKSRNDVPKRERLHFKYSHKAVGVASAGGHLSVLDWFLEKSKDQDPAKRLRFKKTVRTFSWADERDWPSASIEWWQLKGLML